MRPGARSMSPHYELAGAARGRAAGQAHRRAGGGWRDRPRSDRTHRSGASDSADHDNAGSAACTLGAAADHPRRPRGNGDDAATSRGRAAKRSGAARYPPEPALGHVALQSPAVIPAERAARAPAHCATRMRGDAKHRAKSEEGHAAHVMPALVAACAATSGLVGRLLARCAFQSARSTVGAARAAVSAGLCSPRSSVSC